jgi:uncharacterized membrane protein YeaQ/YmgE (transglycosylase-associated protein family)
MAILGWIVFGLIVGVVPKLLMPRRDTGGMIVTMILGIVGALIGGFIGRTLGWYGEEDPLGSIIAVVGAMVVLFVYRRTTAA